MQATGKSCSVVPRGHNFSWQYYYWPLSLFWPSTDIKARMAETAGSLALIKMMLQIVPSNHYILHLCTHSQAKCCNVLGTMKLIVIVLTVTGNWFKDPPPIHWCSSPLGKTMVLFACNLCMSSHILGIICKSSQFVIQRKCHCKELYYIVGEWQRIKCLYIVVVGRLHKRETWIWWATCIMVVARKNALVIWIVHWTNCLF